MKVAVESKMKVIFDVNAMPIKVMEMEMRWKKPQASFKKIRPKIHTNTGMERMMTVALAIGRYRRAVYRRSSEDEPATPRRRRYARSVQFPVGPNGLTLAVKIIGMVKSKIPRKRKHAN